LIYNLATRNEHPERWCLNELESLGISAKREKELNDPNEIRRLADYIERGLGLVSGL
jgi:hypothetical protein